MHFNRHIFSNVQARFIVKVTPELKLNCLFPRLYPVPKVMSLDGFSPNNRPKPIEIQFTI